MPNLLVKSSLKHENTKSRYIEGAKIKMLGITGGDLSFTSILKLLAWIDR